MALPGMRGYGRDDGWAGGRNSSYGRKKVSNNFNDTMNGFSRTGIKTSGGGTTDPAVGRRVDGLEQRLSQQDSANRGILEQLMKIQQDFKMELKKQEQSMAEERNQRMRLETLVSGSVNKLNEMEERLRRAEDSGKENKSALSQLISHTKNVERAVTMSQQDMKAKKEQQGTKIQELYHKLATVQQNRETLERTCYNLRDEVRELEGKMENLSLEVKDFEGAVKMQGVMVDKLSSARLTGDSDERAGKEKKMTETQRAMLEAKIMQNQQATLDLGAKLSTEKRERDSDFDQVNSRITEMVSELTDRERRRETEMRDQEVKYREQANVGSSEKQKIVMQISAVQTEIKRSLEERDSKLREMTVHKLDEMTNKMAENEKMMTQNERDTKTFVDAEMEKQKLYVDHGVDSVRKLQESESEKMRVRMSEVSESLNQIDTEIAQMKSTVVDDIQRVMQEADSREKILEAKIEDQGDKLRLGMGTLQAAIGEMGGDKEGSNGVPLDEVEKMQEDAVAGVRESLVTEMTNLEDEIGVMKTDIRRQDDIISARLKSHQQAGEDASNILGDKLHQKMDSMVFTQERMKRQMDDLQEKVSGAPTDIGDLRTRVEDVERNITKTKGAADGETSQDIKDIRRDVDKILGKDEIGTAEVDGIPSLTQLQTEVDQMNGKITSLSGGVETLTNQTEENINQEKQTREEECAGLKKDIDRLQIKTTELKERIKGKYGPVPDEGEREDGQDEEEGNE